MKRPARTLVGLLPPLLLGVVGLVVGPLLLQALGLSGAAAFGVALFAAVGVPALGAVWLLWRRRRANRARRAAPRETPTRATEPATPGTDGPTTDGPPSRPAPGPHPEEDTVNIDGRWKVTISTPLGRQQGELDVTSDGTTLTGTAQVLGASLPIANGRVDGTELRFTITVAKPMTMDLDFHLLVDGDTIDGTVVAGPMGRQQVVGERS